MVKNRSIDVGLSDRKHDNCDVCKANKLTRTSVPAERESFTTVVRPFERVWTDLKGKLLKDFWGNEYLVTFTCEVTRWTCVYFCQKKSQVKEKFLEFLNWVKCQGHVVRELNSDGGGEYTGNENAKVLSDFQRICLDNGIVQRFTSPDTSAQNGISERLNRTLVEHARTVLHEAGLAREFWSLAVKHIAWLRNRTWHSALRIPGGPGVSPFQVLYGKTPRISMARVFGCDVWRLDPSVKKGSFEPKGKKGIFVGLSAHRKGWLIFDPQTRKVRTSFHCTFDESLEGRRCALRDFDLRQKKAGPGATRDDERLALLERETYDLNVDFHLGDDKAEGFIETKEQRVLADPQRAPQLGSAASPSVLDASKLVGAGDLESPPRHVSPEAPHVEEVHDRPGLVDDDSDDESDHHGESIPHNGTLVENAERGGAGQGPEPQRIEIPKRRAAIGSPQELDEQDTKFLEFAFSHDLPMRMQQRNPKRADSASRVRYEKYKAARTLREIKNRGGTWGDITWDYARGYSDFDNVAGFVFVDTAEHLRASKGIAVAAAARVNSSGFVIADGQFGNLTLEESIQQDYAIMALEHIESQSHRMQRYLQRTLGNQTLVEFAHCCASRILIPEPLTVVEAMASEHAVEWRAAMDEEMANLARFGCFERVNRSDAVKHGKLVKSKWVFKVKYNSDNTVQRFRARLVAKGFTQVPGSDFYETFSPVFSYTSLRTVMAIAVDRDMRLDIWDLKNGFIQQRLDVDNMYMECPDGYSKDMPDGSPAALHCMQSIYGLRQSSRLLHERLSKYLVSLGFKQLISDQCAFVFSPRVKVLHN